MPYAQTSTEQYRDLSERLVELSSRLEAKLHDLHAQVGQDARRPRRPNGGSASPAREPVREVSGSRGAPEDWRRIRRRALLHQKIESAVRRGAIWEALKYEAALDADLLTSEIEHDLDLLISEAPHPSEHDALG